MVEWTEKEQYRVYSEVIEIIDHANGGSRSAYKTIQALKPIIDTYLERWAMQAREGKGPAK